MEIEKCRDQALVITWAPSVGHNNKCSIHTLSPSFQETLWDFGARKATEIPFIMDEATPAVRCGPRQQVLLLAGPLPPLCTIAQARRAGGSHTPGATVALDFCKYKFTQKFMQGKRPC